MLNDADATSVSEELSTLASNNNYARSPRQLRKFLLNAVNNRGKNFNIFSKSTESKNLPHRDPRITQTEV